MICKSNGMTMALMEGGGEQKNWRKNVCFQYCVEKSVFLTSKLKNPNKKIWLMQKLATLECREKLLYG